MKLIEAMKKVKELEAKAADLRKKVHTFCADLSHETPVYGDKQRDQVGQWIQAHSDVLREILTLKTAVQRTNLGTAVSIELGGKPVTKSIAEWIHRRHTLAKLEEAMWDGIGDRGLKEGAMRTSTGTDPIEVKIRRYYDPQERDRALETYRNEPSVIDRTLEVTNAVTDIAA